MVCLYNGETREARYFRENKKLEAGQRKWEDSAVLESIFIFAVLVKIRLISPYSVLFRLV